MALVEPGERGALGVDAALLLDDEHLKMASRIWDTIVKIERDGMYDAELIKKALKFKRDFLARQSADANAAKQIARSWQAEREASQVEAAISTATEPK